MEVDMNSVTGLPLLNNYFELLMLPSSEPTESVLASWRGGETQKDNLTPLNTHFSLGILYEIVRHH